MIATFHQLDAYVQIAQIPSGRVNAWAGVLLDIECALCHVTGVQFDRKICPYKSAIFDFFFAQNVLGRANFALIIPPFCGDNFLTDTR